jgi:hypothetical protein
MRSQVAIDQAATGPSSGESAAIERSLPKCYAGTARAPDANAEDSAK